jgi:hypothetical protein
MLINIPLIGAHDFPYLFLDQAASLWSIPLTWGIPSHDALGVFAISTLWTWVYGIYGLVGKIGVDFTLSTWFFGVIPAILLSFVGMGRLLGSYSLSQPARRVGQLVFSANTYFWMLIDGGQLSLALAYSLLPWALAYLSHRAIFVLIVSAISFLDIRYLYILALPVGLKIIFDLGNLHKYLLTGILTGTILVGLHSYWLLPASMSRGPALPATYTRAEQVEALSFAKIRHAMFAVHPHNVLLAIADLGIFSIVAPQKEQTCMGLVSIGNSFDIFGQGK